MQITIDIDNDVLLAVQSLARSEKKTIGQLINELVQKGLQESGAHQALDVYPSDDQEAPLDYP